MSEGFSTYPDRAWPELGARDAALEPWLTAAQAPEVLLALVGAAEAQARLETRLAHDPATTNGAGRLALSEAADAMWLAGDAGARDRLALYAHGRQAAVDSRDLLADWALRRLQGQGDPAAMTIAGLRSFLGLTRPRSGDAEEWVSDQVDLFPRPVGQELDEALGQWLDVAGRLDGRHRLIRAAVLHRAWRWLGLSGPEDPVTPMIVCTRVGGAGGGAPGFAPLAGAARRLRTFAVSGTEARRLAATLTAFEEAATEASLTCERLSIWRERAAKAAGTRARRAVIEATAGAPVVSTKAIARRAGLTGQAVNGAARALSGQGIIQEVTGQSRFRLWKAAI